MEENESFLPWKKAKVFFTVHSPHFPVNPVFQGDPLKTGHEYRVLVRLVSQALLLQLFVFVKLYERKTKVD